MKCTVIWCLYQVLLQDNNGVPNLDILCLVISRNVRIAWWKGIFRFSHMKNDEIHVTVLCLKLLHDNSGVLNLEILESLQDTSGQLNYEVWVRWYPETCCVVKRDFSVFSSPEPKARVSYCHSAPSVVRPSSVRPSDVNFSHFWLLLQNRLIDFDETW